MAAEVMRALRAESHTLLVEEERLRRHLEQRFAVHTRSAALPDVRALLVSPANEGPKALLVASDTSAAERIYLYVHVAAHLALGHHLPLVTIVEGTPGLARLDADAHQHHQAERLARAMWWGRNDDLAAPRSVRGSAVLRELVSRGATRAALRSVLLALRAAYYDLRIERALARTPLAVWLRDALCVTAVVAVAPQLSD